MQKRKFGILAAAAMGATPALVHAIPSVTFSYDATQMQISTTSTFTTGANTTTIALTNSTVSVPVGDYFRFGVDVAVANNPNAASGGAYDQAAGQTDPANLGLAGMGFVFNTSNSAVLNPVVTTSVPPTAVTKFSFPAGSTTGKGNVNIVNGQIGTGGAYLSAGLNPGAYDGTSATFSLLNYASTNTLAFSNVAYHALIGGSSVITPIIPAGATAVVALDPAYTNAASNTSAPDYISSTNITTNNLPALTVNVTGGVTSTTSSTGGTNKIISLVTSGAPTGTAPNGYGSAPLATLTVSGSNGKYFPGYANISGGATSGYVAVSGFTPTDVPVFALQVAVGGVVLAPTDTRLAAIIADIKGSDSNVSSGITTVAGSAFAGIFPGFDILIPGSVAAGSSPYFAFDFSTADGTNSDTALGPVTVTAIAAVPEPATAAGLVIGAASLLLGRRKNRALVA